MLRRQSSGKRSALPIGPTKLEKVKLKASRVLHINEEVAYGLEYDVICKMQSMTLQLQKVIDDQENALKLLSRHFQSVDSSLQELSKLPINSSGRTLVSKHEAEQHSKKTDEIQTITKSCELSLRQARSQIATSNSNISTIYVAIQASRDGEALLKKASQEEAKTMGKGLSTVKEHLLTKQGSDAVNLNIPETLSSAVNEQLAAYSSVFSSVGTLLPLLHQAYSSKGSIVGAPRSSGMNIAMPTDRFSAGISATGEIATPVRFRYNAPSYPQTLQEASDDRMQSMRLSATPRKESNMGSIYMKPPGRCRSMHD